MCLGKDTIKSILNADLVLDFIKITLTQQKEDNPKVYTGSGSIFQDTQGGLRLKMYHEYLLSNVHRFADGLNAVCVNGLSAGELFNMPMNLPQVNNSKF
jgi:hypothetical protein